MQKTAKNIKNKIFLIFAVCAALIIVTASVFGDWRGVYGFFGLAENTAFASGEGVSVHFIDVGQGDCALILTPSKSVLIDSGELGYASAVFNYLIAQNVKKLDYIIATHPHSDHIGSMSEVINYFGARLVILPEIPDELVTTTGAYLRLLESIYDNSAEAVYARRGMKFDLGSGAEMEIIAPLNDYEKINDYSVVVKFTHAGNSFLFTGDIENSAESDIADNGGVSADVLFVAHHGSNSSSTSKFLNAVGGRYAVISVGSPNSYNHPRPEVISRISSRDYIILRTDLHGNIVFDSTGAGLFVYTQKGE